METTATFVPESKGGLKGGGSFVIHSPTLTSSKFWPGSLGRTANHAMVIANLIDGQGVDRGIHNFLVPLRSMKDHSLLPGYVYTFCLFLFVLFYFVLFCCLCFILWCLFYFVFSDGCRWRNKCIIIHDSLYFGLRVCFPVYMRYVPMFVVFFRPHTTISCPLFFFFRAMFRDRIYILYTRLFVCGLGCFPFLTILSTPTVSKRVTLDRNLDTMSWTMALHILTRL